MTRWLVSTASASCTWVRPRAWRSCIRRRPNSLDGSFFLGTRPSVEPISKSSFRYTKFHVYNHERLSEARTTSAGLDMFREEASVARISDVELERLKRDVSLERLAEAKGVKLERRGKDTLTG